uniref:Protein phosphatase 1 regulatory subunit 14 n=1 Tax=Felis catus TaxID=9685 RepID=A0ABI7X2N8_FELCA
MAAQRLGKRVLSKLQSPSRARGPGGSPGGLQKRHARVTVKYDRRELQRRLDVEKWIDGRLEELYRGREADMPDEVNIDELLELESEEERSRKIQGLLKSCKNPTEVSLPSHAAGPVLAPCILVEKGVPGEEGRRCLAQGRQGELWGALCVAQPSSHLQWCLCLPHPGSSLPICHWGPIISSPLRRSPSVSGFCLSSAVLSLGPPVFGLSLSPGIPYSPPWAASPFPTSGALPSLQALKLSGPTPPTSFPALKGKNIHVSLNGSGLPEGQTSLCVCLPWSEGLCPWRPSW